MILTSDRTSVRIVERGSHAELLVRYGLYQCIWNLQKRLLLEMNTTSKHI